MDKIHRRHFYVTNCQIKCNFLPKKTSDGLFQPKTLRGRLFKSWTNLLISWSVNLSRSVPLGKYFRIRPLVFSSVTRCCGALFCRAQVISLLLFSYLLHFNYKSVTQKVLVYTSWIGCVTIKMPFTQSTTMGERRFNCLDKLNSHIHPHQHQLTKSLKKSATLFNIEKVWLAF